MKTFVDVTTLFVLIAVTHSFSQNVNSFVIPHGFLFGSTLPIITIPSSSSRISSRFMTGGDFFSDDFELPTEANDDDETSDEEFAEASEFEEHIPRVNSVTLVGRVGQDPDPKYLDDGKVVLNLSLAVKRKYHPLERNVRNIKSGEEETDWFPLEIWGRDAEYASKYVDKGSRMMVTGTLQIDTWTDRNTGEPRKKAKIIVRHLDILETKAEAELRRGSKSSYGGGGYSGGNNNNNNNNDDGPSSAGTGGFFD